jgi:glycosyltransferase involved in cell wall biosynthesis
MKISIIGPGFMSIPPIGWGAVESLVWDYSENLKKNGHNVQIVNTSNHSEIVNLVNSFDPDFVHLQYDDYAYLMKYIKCKNKAITTHYAYTEQYEKHPEYRNILNDILCGDFYIFCLSEKIKDTYSKLNFPKDKLIVTPNGVREDLFIFEDECLYKDKSIYLAKIDYRKRQYLYQDIKSLYFAGRCEDSRFNTQSDSYLGEWSKDYLYKNLTKYSNLVLLSDGEADPLVTKEALISGLGLVISEYSTANLDLKLPFISVIPEDKIKDNEYVFNCIDKNRKICNSMRSEIRKYALENLSFNVVIPKYLDIIHSIVNQ